LSGKVKHFSLPCDQFHLHAFAIVNDVHDKPPFSVFGLLLPAAGQLFSIENAAHLEVCQVASITDSQKN
ncbi:MAG TPA: hypothetical protein VN300_04840, partial [Desulfobacterales bacterium]|nr:hypothetical protein [Desulfobacterales bacterium]